MPISSNNPFTDLGSLESDVLDLQAEVTSNDADILNLFIDSGNKTSQINDINNDITALQTALGTANSAITTNTGNIVALQTLVGGVDVTALAAQVLLNQNNIADNDAAITALQLLAHPESERIEVLLSGQTNTNSSTVGNALQLSGATFGNIIGASVSAATDLVTLPAGNYIMFLELSFTSNSARANIATRSLINGAVTATKTLGAYIRAASGHNESGGSFIESFSLVAPSTLEIQVARMAAAGTVNLIAARSRLIILKVSG